MKKGDIVEAVIIKSCFPGKAIGRIEGETNPIHLKGAVPGQRVRARITKKRSDKYEGIILEVIQKASNETEPSCPHFGICGGCIYQNLSYEDQLKLKDSQIREIFSNAIEDFDDIYEGIKGSPVSERYRNKMEFSFGNACKDGELELGLHKKGSFYDIVSVDKCSISDEDYGVILRKTLDFFRNQNCSFYHKMTHEGFLRHLLLRKSKKFGEILVCLVTSSQFPEGSIDNDLIGKWSEMVLGLNLSGKISGILHIINDSLSDVVQSDETRLMFGNDYIREEVLGLNFKISPFSFFQTNTLSAEVIYSTAREYIGNAKGVIFDLYSGTGTIGQLMAPVAKKVIGVEIVPEAVEAANENATLNGLKNCSFIADDVLNALDNISEKPDYIILDPPRDGVNPKALRKIIDYGVENILYISCKPTSLVRDLQMLSWYYKPVRACAVDQFPFTKHVETVVLIQRKDM